MTDLLTRLYVHWTINSIHGFWWRLTGTCPRHRFYAIVDDDGEYLYHACLTCRAREVRASERAGNPGRRSSES